MRASRIVGSAPSSTNFHSVGKMYSVARATSAPGATSWLDPIRPCSAIHCTSGGRRRPSHASCDCGCFRVRSCRRHCS